MSHEDLNVFKKRRKDSFHKLMSDVLKNLNGTSDDISIVDKSNLCVGMTDLNPMQKRFIDFLETDTLTGVTYHFKEYGNCFFDFDNNEFTMEVSKRGAGKTTALMCFIKSKVLSGMYTSDVLYVTPHPNESKRRLRENQLEDVTVVDFGLIRGDHLKKLKGSGYKLAIFDEIKWSEAKDLDIVKADKKIYAF